LSQRGAPEATTAIVNDTFLHGFFNFGLVEWNEPVWHPSFIDFVIRGEEYIEKESKIACAIENSDIAHANAVSPVLSRE